MVCLHQGAGKKAGDDLYALRARGEREERMRLELFVNTSDILLLLSPYHLQRVLGKLRTDEVHFCNKVGCSSRP